MCNCTVSKTVVNEPPFLSIAQFGSAPDLGSGGREFESLYSDLTSLGFCFIPSCAHKCVPPLISYSAAVIAENLHFQ